MNSENNQASVDESEALSDVQISDQVLEKEDQIKKQESKAAKKRAKKLRTPEEVKRLKKRNLIIVAAVLISAVLLLFSLPVSRWFLLNALGFRGNLTVLVQDKKSFETITDVDVLMDDNLLGTTDSSGQLRLSGIRLGSHRLQVQKDGYSRYSQKITVGLKSSQQNVSLEAIGIKISVAVKNWLNEKPIAGAVIKSGSNKATTDSTGLANFIVLPTDQKTKVVISAKNYLDRTVELDSRVESRDVTLVSSSKDYFISKRSGNYDIYSSNLDGSSQKKIIDATGKENPNFLQFEIHRLNKKAILVATREGKKINERIVAGVYLVNLENASLSKIDEGSDVRLLGWAGDSIVYTKTNPSLKYDDKNFSSLMSYSIASGVLSKVSTANYFQIASVVGKSVFYMPSPASGDNMSASLTGLNLTTGTSQTYLKNKQISYGFQADYGVLQIETLDSNYYQINSLTGTTSQLDSLSSNEKRYTLNFSGQSILFTELRDGKGALISKNLANNKEQKIISLGGLTYPIRSVSDSLIIARVVTNQETADYVIDSQTGKLAKIVDVTNVGQQY
jgi:hypothetical protein